MKTGTSSKIRQLNLVMPEAKHDHIQGPIDATLALVEYGDYECPYCGEAFPIVKAIQQRLGNRLCFAFRNYPLVNSHPHAEHAAEAAEAAGAQSHFWEMHDLLFENQDALEDNDLARYAAELGLDAQRVLREIQTSAYRDRVREDFRRGTRGGVDGTPTFFINGIRFDGEPSVEGLLTALSEAEEVR